MFLLCFVLLINNNYNLLFTTPLHQRYAQSKELIKLENEKGPKIKQKKK